MPTRRREFLKALGLAGGAAVLGEGIATAAGRRPNLLFIWTDEQRSDTMACYGNSFIKAPNLNRLAGTSFVFERAYCAQPLCSPSRATILTGMWPHTHGLIRNNVPLPKEHPTIAEMLGDDYHSAYYGKWHLGDEYVAQRGFAEWKSIEDHYRPHFSDPEYLKRTSDYHQFLVSKRQRPRVKGAGGVMLFSRNHAAKMRVELTKASFLGQEAAKFISAQKPDRPWMLSVNFLEPHMPFTGPLNKLHDPAKMPVGPAFFVPPDESVASRKRQNAEWSRKKGYGGQRLRTADDWRKLRARYYGLVSLVDRALGAMLEALEASGQAGNTIVVFTSDHGDMMGDHACLAKCLMYEESIRIPLLIRVPWLTQKQLVVKGRVSQVDLVPTLLDLMGRDVPRHLQGTSRAKVLARRGSLEENDVVVEWSPDDVLRTIVSREGWKLSLCVGGKHELYDHNTDPHELKNLYGKAEHRRRVRELADRIRAWQKATGDTAKLPEDVQFHGAGLP